MQTSRTPGHQERPFGIELASTKIRMQFCSSTFLAGTSAAEGLRGTGEPQRPSRRSEGPYASP
jgi:hypothetical protein